MDVWFALVIIAGIIFGVIVGTSKGKETRRERRENDDLDDWDSMDQLEGDEI